MKDHDEVIGPLSAETVEALRVHQQPPGGERYWDLLHSGIMSRLGDPEIGWWTVLTRWSRPALAAAAIVMLIATAAVLTLGTPTQAIAYDEVIEAQPLAPDQTVLASNPRTAREATLRYVLSY